MKTLLLSQEDVKSVVGMKDAVEICERTFQGMGEGTVVNPTKVLLDLGETGNYPYYGGFFNAMPAYIGWLDLAGIKWVGGFMNPKRQQLGLPYINGMILLADPRLGMFLAAMDGAYITSLRTGAQTAVALKYLLPGRKKLRLGLYGAGGQGHTQTLAISQWFELEQVTVYDVCEQAKRRYAEDMKEVVKGEIRIAKKPEEAADAGVVICVTQARESFLKKEWVKPGTIVFPMGSHQECEEELLLAADHIVVDHVGQCAHRGALAKVMESGKMSVEAMDYTIGELAAGKRSMEDISGKRVICIPVGTGAMDVSVAGIAYFRARERGLGQEFEFVNFGCC